MVKNKMPRFLMVRCVHLLNLIMIMDLAFAKV